MLGLIQHVGDDGGIVRVHKEGDQILAEEEDHHEGDGAVDAAQKRCRLQALMDAVDLARTDVLPGVGCHGAGQRVDHDAEQHAHLARSGHGGHGDGAQTVNGDGHGQRADGGDGILEAEGQAHAQQAADEGLADAGVVRVHLQHGELAHQHPQAPQSAGQLADDGGPGRACHTHVEEEDEHDVQHDVEQRRDDDGQHGGAAVAQGAHDARCHVVQHRGRNGKEHRLDVGDGLVHQLIPGVEHVQQQRRAKAGDQPQRHRNDGTQVHRMHDETAQLRVILGALGLGDGDRKAGAKAHAEAVDQEIQRAGGAHSRQCVIAQEAADDGGINEGVQLLEQEAAQQGQGEADEQLHGRALGQIALKSSCHREEPLCMRVVCAVLTVLLYQQNHLHI